MATDRHVRSRRWASSYFPRHSCFAMHISFILARLNWNASKNLLHMQFTIISRSMIFVFAGSIPFFSSPLDAETGLAFYRSFQTFRLHERNRSYSLVLTKRSFSLFCQRREPPHPAAVQSDVTGKGSPHSSVDMYTTRETLTNPFFPPSRVCVNVVRYPNSSAGLVCVLSPCLNELMAFLAPRHASNHPGVVSQGP